MKILIPFTFLTLTLLSLPNLLQAQLVIDNEPSVKTPAQRASQQARVRAFDRIARFATAASEHQKFLNSQSIHYDYTNVSIYADRQANNQWSDSDINAHAIGTDFVFNGLYFDFTYEHAKETFKGSTSVQDYDTFTTTTAKDISDWLYLFAIGGYGESEFNSANVNQRNRGNLFFINPGVGAVFAMGDWTFTGGLSYMYQTTDSASGPGGPTLGKVETGQVMLDLGAHYFITSKLTARATLQLTHVFDQDYPANVQSQYDFTWLNVGAGLGYELNNRSRVFADYTYTTAHDLLDIHSFQVGGSIDL